MRKIPEKLRSPLIGLKYDDKISSPIHQHYPAQLIYCCHGCFELLIENKVFVITPANAVWIPSNVLHLAKSREIVHYRSIYINPNYNDALPKDVEIINVHPLLKHLIIRACDFKDGYKENSAESRVAEVIIDEITNAKKEEFYASISPNPKIKSLYKILSQDKFNKQSMNYFANYCHMSSRTLNRLIHKELGLSFEQWRLQIKTIKAISLLSQGHSISSVSGKIGYSNESTFIEMIKKRTGHTPSYFRNKFKNKD